MFFVVFNFNVMLFCLRSNDFKIKKKQSSFLSKKKNEQHNIKIEQENNALINKFTFQLKSKLDGCEIRAKLLESPCLKAAYLINNVECNAFIKNERSKISCLLNTPNNYCYEI